jgi:predicted nucleotidyltransferase
LEDVDVRGWRRGLGCTETVEVLLDLNCMQRLLRSWNIRYAVVFGSAARCRVTPLSDVDIAVKAGRRLGLRERGLLLGELEDCLKQKRRVDLVVLDDREPIVAWEALSKGVLVYVCGRECLTEYYEDLAWALDMVADMEPLLRMLRRRVEHALAGARGESP